MIFGAAIVLVLIFSIIIFSKGDSLKSVSTKEFKELIDSRSAESVILDVRTSEEFQEGHIKDAISIDFYSPTFAGDLSKFDKDKTYYIYCRSGSRSGKTLEIMNDLGFTSVYNLEKGINDWTEKGYEIQN